MGAPSSTGAVPSAAGGASGADQDLIWTSTQTVTVAAKAGLAVSSAAARGTVKRGIGASFRDR
ncbi:MAG: hypothetical protein R3F60_16825 [bacterium]